MRSLALALLLLALARPAWAWGDEGHAIVALIAQNYLRPEVRRTVEAMLAADPDPLTAHDIGAEASWADRFRDANIDGSRERTRQWHFADIEVGEPSLDAACFGHPRLQPGRPASDGPARDCVVDKIDQFAAELADPLESPEEQLLALKFLLHFVGDVHQPLHAADEEDRGGNDEQVSAPGFRPGRLHHYWDTEFVELLGPDPRGVAATLLRQITPAQLRQWARGTPSDWAMESFAVARDDVYAKLPQPGRRWTYRLNQEYIDMATAAVARQLSKAGVRLAFVLNTALGRR